MATQDANPPHDSREGTPDHQGADQPERGDDSLGQDSTAHHDNRESDQTYQGKTPAGSGGADSFDSRHNEFDPSEGQAGAGVDDQGKAVHGDGLRHQQAEEPRPEGFDADQPQQVDDGTEPNAEQPKARD